MSYLLDGLASSLIPIRGKLRCTWCCQSCSRRTVKMASSQVLPGSVSSSRGGPREADVSRLHWLPVFPGEGSPPGVSSRGRVRPQEGTELPRRVVRRAALAKAAATRGGRLRFLHYPDRALNAGDDDDSSGKSFALSGGFLAADGGFMVKLRRVAARRAPTPGEFRCAQADAHKQTKKQTTQCTPTVSMQVACALSSYYKRRERATIRRKKFSALQN